MGDAKQEVVGMMVSSPSRGARQASFRLWWQDYTGWPSARAEDAPPPKWQNFRTIEAARNAQAEIKAKSGPEVAGFV